MGKIILDAHPSVVVAHCEDLGQFLFSVYDTGYPRKAYRLSANNIGGNPEPYNISPEQVLIHEIAEEFDPNHDKEKKFVGEVNWASEEDIRFIRNGLLGKIEPLEDFRVIQNKEIDGGNAPYKAIFSVFYTSISGEVIECAEKNIRDGRNVPTEGLIGVYTLDELAKSSRGEFSTAHITAHILNWKYGSSIPHPKQLSADPIGLPRKSFKDYTTDFEYNEEKLAKASRAEN